MQQEPNAGRDSSTAVALCDQGKARLEEGRFELAVTDLSEALRIDPKLVDALFNRGVAFSSLNELDSSIADFTEIMLLEPQWHSAYSWRGSLFLRMDKFAEAVTDLSEAIRLQPNDRQAFALRGVALQRDGEHDAAIADFEKAIQLSPDSTDALLYRGRSYERLGDSCEAIADFTQVIELDPTCGPAFQFRGGVWLEEGDFEQALADLTEAIRLGPPDASAYYYRGVVWCELEDFAKAIADFSHATQLDIKNGGFYLARGDAWDEVGEHEKADADFEMAEQLPIEEDEETMLEQRTLVFKLLQNHFSPIPLSTLSITERSFPIRVRADLQQGIDNLIQHLKVRHFCGVHGQYSHEGTNFTQLLVRNRHQPQLAVAPQYEEIDIGEQQPLRCLNDGLWLLEVEGQRTAVFLEPRSAYRPRSEVRVQIATSNDDVGVGITQRFFQRLEQAVQEAKCYRGKILSLEQGDRYSGTSTGIKVHKLQTVDKDQVILPCQTLELLERNVIKFAQQRPQLAKLGMATKKGLLFYGPPGTGKTHTIHYLAGALQGMTTLLISAEQVGLLDEYMTLARLLQPSMVVIEDADLIARERSSMSNSCEEVLLNKLLNEMDGLKESADILFVLTTNRPETLEAALASRPGRIDQAIEFPFPDGDGRTKLVHLYARGTSVSDDLVRLIVQRTENVSAAFIKELMRRATQFQLERDGSAETTLADVENALEELLFAGGSLNRKLLGGKVGERLEE